MPSGTLYIVATPIGNLEDLSQRAIHTLRDVDLIAVEDTRHSARLLQHYQITTPTTSLHEHNEKQRITFLLKHLQSGLSVALISDAGTPLISDPGYALVNALRTHDITISPIPGPCAAIAALSAAGLPSDRFRFEGFLPAKSTARQQRLQTLLAETCTLIFYESPYRILASLQDMQKILGSDRHIVIARELTKTFETFYQDTASNLVRHFTQHPAEQRGEFTIIVAGSPAPAKSELSAEDMHILQLLSEKLSLKEASKIAAEITGKNKNAFYKAALQREETC